MNPLKYKYVWLSIGYMMVAFVIYSSLTTSPVTPGFKLSDKLMHVIGYFGLMGWFMQIYHDKKIQLWIALAFISMGVGLEFLQDMGGVRVFELNDMIANVFGVLLAYVLVKILCPDWLIRFEQIVLAKK